MGVAKCVDDDAGLASTVASGVVDKVQMAIRTCNWRRDASKPPRTQNCELSTKRAMERPSLDSQKWISMCLWQATRTYPALHLGGYDGTLSSKARHSRWESEPSKRIGRMKPLFNYTAPASP